MMVSKASSLLSLGGLFALVLVSLCVLRLHSILKIGFQIVLKLVTLIGLVMALPAILVVCR